MSEADQELADALVLVRELWIQEEVPERTVAWATMIETVDRLAALHGPARTGRLLEGLVQEVRDWPALRVLQ